MNKLIVKVEKVKDILVTTSNRVAMELGVRHDNLLIKIDNYITKFSSPILSGQFYIASDYKTKDGRTTRNYLITEKGIAQLVGGYSSAVAKAFDLNVAYINEFERMKQELSKPKLPNTYLEALKELVAKEEALLEANNTIEKQVKEIEYKEDVIVGLTDDITLKDKRQILNQVVRYKGSNFQERWKALYFEFEKKYHINLKRRFENYNKSNSPKMKNKIDYIERIMKKLPELYEIATKLFEGDIKEIIKEYEFLKN